MFEQSMEGKSTLHVSFRVVQRIRVCYVLVRVPGSSLPIAPYRIVSVQNNKCLL